MFANKVLFRVDETTSPPNHHRSKFQSQEKKVFRVDEMRFFRGWLIWVRALIGEIVIL